MNIEDKEFMEKYILNNPFDFKQGIISHCREMDKIDVYNWVAEDELKIDKLQQENKILRENAENNDKVVDKVNWENQLLKKENKQLKDLIDTILNFSLFKEECPLNFGFENNTNEDKSQSIFYENQWCENNCNDNYKDCWLKYFKKLQELEQGGDNNG